jgi:hypothetical protein
VTTLELLDAIDAELADLMGTRADDPASTIGYAFRILALTREARIQYAQERWSMDRGLELALIVGEVPANGVES